MNILIIGNSFVEGVAAKDNFGWAQRLRNKFAHLNVLISGVGGDNILKINNRLDRLPQKKFDFVFLEVGINDSRYRPSINSEEVPIRQFKDGIKYFATHFRESNPSVRIFVLGLTRVDERKTTPYKEDKHYLNSNITKYDRALKEISQEIGLIYLSVPLLNDQDSLLADGIHPSDEGHKEIYLRILEQLGDYDDIFA